MNFTDVFGSQTVPPAEESFAEYAVTGTESYFVWPDQYGGQGLLLADITELTPSGGGVQVTLPPADAVSRGESFILRNRGAENIELLNTDSVPQALLPPGESLFLYIDDNATPAGGWSSFVYGTGTSAADASELAGRGLVVESGRLNANAEYRALNSNYLMSEIDRAQVLDATVGTLTITTPDAVSVGNGFYAFIRNSSAGNLTLEGYSTQTVNGALSITFAPGDSVILMSTGTNWVTVGYGRSVSGQFSEVIVNAAAGNVTLSSSDVAGRMIRVSGTATANITVTLPAIDNIYFVVVEAGMGSYGVAFTTGSGVVTVLTANERTVLTSDGTNVLAAVTTTVTSSLALVDGSAVAPSISFSLDTDTGLFRKGNNVIGVAVGGAEVGSFGSSGFVGNVTGNVTGNVSGNVSGNAGTVTNGVYTTGNQTIGGTKTFSSPIVGSITGNAGTATALQTARTIGGVSFDGTANINLPGVNIAGNQDTSGNAGTVTNGVYTTGNQTIGGNKTFSGTATFSGVVDGPALVNKMFPVGSIYITATATSPASFLGGTWAQIAQGRTLIGVGTLGSDTYAAGDTGGAARVTLTTTEMPSHNHGGATGTQSENHTHTFSETTSSGGAHAHSFTVPEKSLGSATQHALDDSTVSGNRSFTTASAGAHTHTLSGTTDNNSTNHTHSVSAQGGGLAHENRMPYLAVYFWQRTA